MSEDQKTTHSRNGKSSNGGGGGGKPPIRMAQPNDDLRPEITLSTDLHTNVAYAVAALANHRSVYKRAGQLVRVVPSDERGKYGRVSIPKINPIHRSITRSLLTESAVFLAKNKKGDFQPCLPPDTITDAVHNEDRWQGVRPLSAVSTIPVIRKDGTILQTEGYDKESGYLYLAIDHKTCEVPDSPTKEDALRALDAILDLVSDFPFQTPADRSAWLAALFTVMGRSAIDGVVPMFGIDASTRGSGKTKLVQLISILATGNEAPVIPPPTDEEEFKKLITSQLRQGSRIVLIDNVIRKFGGGALDALTTSLRWTDRVLGGSNMVTIENLSCWFATGNNIHLASDMSRRTLMCRIQPDDQRPEDRSDFKYPDLQRHVHDHRMLLVAQIMTVLRAWHVAGKPGTRDYHWGSFEGWASFVPPLLVWLGQPSPLDRRASLEEDQDEDRLALDALCAWMQSRGPLAAPEIIKRLELRDGPDTVRDVALTHLESLAGIKGGRGIDLKSLPYVLRRWKGRACEGGFRLQSFRDTTKNTALWEFRRISADSTDMVENDVSGQSSLKL